MATLRSRKYSILTFEYVSGSLVFDATFALGVMTPNHIQVYVEGELDGLGEQVYRDFAYDEVSETITVSDPIPVPVGKTSVQVVLQRTVPKDPLYISFKGGADVTRTNIDGLVTYTMMALHEVLDGRWDISDDWSQLYDDMKDMYNQIMDMLGGGTTGQVLSKASNTDYDFSWITLPVVQGLPAGGNLGDVLVKTTDGHAWQPIESVIPTKLTVYTEQVDAGTPTVFTLTPAMMQSIRLVKDTVTDVYLLDTEDWIPHTELIIQGPVPFTIHLLGPALGQDEGVDLLYTYNAPMGMLVRYMGGGNWLFLGSGEFQFSGGGPV